MNATMIVKSTLGTKEFSTLLALERLLSCVGYKVRCQTGQDVESFSAMFTFVFLLIIIRLQTNSNFFIQSCIFINDIFLRLGLNLLAFLHLFLCLLS